MDAVKGALRSKSMWVGALLAAAGVLSDTLFPVFDAWIAAHPGPAATIGGGIMMVLRSLTNRSLAAKAPPSA